MKNYVYMTDKDNVVTMIRQLNAGEAIEVDGVKIKSKPGYSCIPQNCDRRNKNRGDGCKIW